MNRFILSATILAALLAMLPPAARAAEDAPTKKATVAPAGERSSSDDRDDDDGDGGRDAKGSRKKDCDCAHPWGRRHPRVAIAIGGTWERYTGENQVTNNAGNSISGNHHYDLDLNVAVFFRPPSDSTIFGIALDFTNDSWTQDPNTARITQFFIGARSDYYFSNEIGRGLFANAKLGLVAFDNLAGTETGRTTQATDTGSPIGFGVGLGTGYAFKVSDRVSILAAFDWSFRKAGASTAMPMTLSGGVLF